MGLYSVVYSHLSMMLKRNPRLSVIIPNWNGKNFLKTCLPSLRNQSFKDFETLVIDNGSTDGSVEYIRNNFPGIKLIENLTNIGFSPAVNLGIKICIGDDIVLLNNDTKVDQDCLKYLVIASDIHPEVGMVAAKMLSYQNPKLIDSAGDYIDVVGHANNIGYLEKDGPKFEKGGYVFLVTGGGGLFRRKVFEKVGFFDEQFFAYFEDVDFGLRAQSQGFKAWFEPKAIIYHIHKGTSSRNKAFTEYLQFRNMTMTIIKNFPNKLLLKDLNFLKILLVNLNTIRYLATKGYLIEALKADYFVLVNLFSLLKKRKVIQSNRKVGIDYIISNIYPKKITLFGLLKNGI